ncbi:hypothetical protein ISG25_36725, partial [Burkholderia pseudomallei]|nr:hypothetical protein [Burkholderia pseudomallei]
AEEPLARAHPFDRLLRWALAQPTPAGLAQCLRDAQAQPQSQSQSQSSTAAPSRTATATATATAATAATAAARAAPAASIVHAPAPRGRIDVRPLRLAPGVGVPRV